MALNNRSCLASSPSPSLSSSRRFFGCDSENIYLRPDARSRPTLLTIHCCVFASPVISGTRGANITKVAVYDIKSTQFSVFHTPTERFSIKKSKDTPREKFLHLLWQLRLRMSTVAVVAGLFVVMSPAQTAIACLAQQFSQRLVLLHCLNGSYSSTMKILTAINNASAGAACSWRHSRNCLIFNDVFISHISAPRQVYDSHLFHSSNELKTWRGLAWNP